MAVPKFDELFNPVLKAIHQLGGSGSVSEIEDEVISILKLSDKDINEIHRGSRTKLNYYLAWARNYLKRYGLIENSARGIWSLTSKGRSTTKVDKNALQRELAKEQDVSIEEEVAGGKTPETSDETWQEKLLIEIKNISPEGFEKLCQRILREAGFIKVEVTGKTGDGGIDGIGIMRLNGFLTFHLIFQCKRYAGSVSAGQIRDFRGAMQGRADKGLFMTTGTFTRDARMEASRPGAAYIDLVDGNDLVEKMKEFGLGVKTQVHESIDIDKEWFKGF